MKDIIIAIDGYSACGKSTLAKGMAKELNYLYLDTGAMYRALTWYFLENDYNWDDPTERADVLAGIDMRFTETPNGQRVVLNDRMLDAELRSMEVSDRVCDLAAIGVIREKLVAYQRKIGAAKRVVMDGRDIGTVVFPNAELKLFVTAKMEVRVERRYTEVINQGQQISREQVHFNLRKRDLEETSRTESPLVQATDAILLDNSALNQAQQLERALQFAQEVMQ